MSAATAPRYPFDSLLDLKPHQPSEPGLAGDRVPAGSSAEGSHDDRHNSFCSHSSVSVAFQSLLDKISQQHRAELLDRDMRVDQLQAMLLKLNAEIATGAIEALEDLTWTSEASWTSEAARRMPQAEKTRLPKNQKNQGKRKMHASQILEALDMKMESEKSFHADLLDPEGTLESGSTVSTTPSNRWKVRLQSTTFEVIIAAMLCLNVFWMAMELQIYGSMAGYSIGLVVSPLVQEQDRALVDTVFVLGDVMFSVFFALDVLVRMYVFKSDFWKVWSNYIDTVVSLASGVQVALLFSQALPVNLALLRLLRIGKLARPIRMITMSSVMASLQLLIKCVTGSVNMLFWSMCLLFVLQCVAGMVVSTLCRDFIANPVHPIELRQEVFQYFGTFSRTMLTMFETLFANWGTPCRVLVEDISEWFSVFFLLYRCVFGFSILNVVNAVFVQQTLKTANSDEEIAFKQKEREMAIYGRRVKTLFQTVDESGDGLINYDEFSKLVQSPKLKFWMSQFHDLLSLFEFLGCDLG